VGYWRGVERFFKRPTRETKAMPREACPTSARDAETKTVGVSKIFYVSPLVSPVSSAGEEGVDDMLSKNSILKLILCLFTKLSNSLRQPTLLPQRLLRP